MDEAPLTSQMLADRLHGMGLALPGAPSARGRYLPAVRDGSRVWVSGHTGRSGVDPATAGCVGRDLTLDDARTSARLAAVNVIAAALTATPAEHIGGVLFLRGYVCSTTDFTDHPLVVDAASEVLDGALGGGGHARAAIGVCSLPGGACVELEAVLSLR